MKLEQNGTYFYWRWTWGYLRVTSFHETTAGFRLYHGLWDYGYSWWSLWFSHFNIDWDSTYFEEDTSYGT